MKKLIALAAIIAIAGLALVACADKTKEASDAMIVIFDKATAGIVKATTAMKAAKDAKSVAAVIDQTTIVLTDMTKEIAAFGEKFKNARGSEDKALAAISDAQGRFTKAQGEFQTAMGAIDTSILSSDEVQAALKKMQELKQ